jgi:SAM-dependent methyltransferase
VTPGGSPREFGQAFDHVAVAYDEVRPGYPAVLVDAAIERGGLARGARVLEVGCGTGKLTELLAARGLHVDAVDPGPNMIEAARKRVGETGRVRFHVATFEDLPVEPGSYAAVFSATAFHWVDPAVGWSKAAALLEPGGLLALVTYVALGDDGNAVEVEEALLAVLRNHAPELAVGWRLPRDLETLLNGIDARRGNVSEVWDWVMQAGRHELARAEAAELFGDVEVLEVLESLEQTADELIAYFRTTALHSRIEPAQRAALEADDRAVIERFGGTLRSTTATVLVTARRTGEERQAPERERSSP